MENNDVIADPLKTRVDKVQYGAIASIIANALLPHDREEKFANQPVVPKLPGLANLKDVPGGPLGIAKGIIVDNAKPIFGAQPFGKEDQPGFVEDQVGDPALAILEAIFEQQKRVKLADFDRQTLSFQRDVLSRLQKDEKFRASVASTPEGRAFLASKEIRISPRDVIGGIGASIAKSTAPKKAGGPAGIVGAVASAAGAVVAGATQVERFFAANPPDP